MNNELSREKKIVKASIIGIVTNIGLALMKLIVGIVTFSLSIILDAINNAGDALSSIVAIFGVKIGSKPADKGHPLGHGRAEYMSAIIIAGLIIAASFSSLFEAIDRIINPSNPNYSYITLILIGVAILVKIVLGLYTLGVSKKTDSSSLKASGFDALFDALISLATLISVTIYLIWGLNLDAYFSIAISLVILKEGIDLILESMNRVLGERVDASLAKAIKEEILLDKKIEGVYDLMLDNYGPTRMIGFAHLEVDENLSALEIDELCRKTTSRIYAKYGAYISYSIYATPGSDSPYHEMYLSIKEKVTSIDGVLQLHGFHVNEEEKTIYFDVVRDFSIKDIEKWKEDIEKASKDLYPDYSYIIEADLDYSD